MANLPVRHANQTTNSNTVKAIYLLYPKTPAGLNSVKKLLASQVVVKNRRHIKVSSQNIFVDLYWYKRRQITYLTA